MVVSEPKRWEGRDTQVERQQRARVTAFSKSPRPTRTRQGGFRVLRSLIKALHPPAGILMLAVSRGDERRDVVMQLLEGRHVDINHVA
jgi:hypothetical protein